MAQFKVSQVKLFMWNWFNFRQQRRILHWIEGVSVPDCFDIFPPSCRYILVFWQWIMLYLQGQELVKYLVLPSVGATLCATSTKYPDTTFSLSSLIYISNSETFKKYSISEPISCLLSSLNSKIAKKVTGLKVEYCYTEEVFPYLLAFKLSETVIINQQFYQSWIINPFILALRKINVRQVYQHYFWFCLIRRHQSPEPEPDWSILPKSKRQRFY